MTRTRKIERILIAPKENGLVAITPSKGATSRVRARFSSSSSIWKGSGAR